MFLLEVCNELPLSPLCCFGTPWCTMACVRWPAGDAVVDHLIPLPKPGSACLITPGSRLSGNDRGPAPHWPAGPAARPASFPGQHPSLPTARGPRSQGCRVQPPCRRRSCWRCTARSRRTPWSSRRPWWSLSRAATGHRWAGCYGRGPGGGSGGGLGGRPGSGAGAQLPACGLGECEAYAAGQDVPAVAMPIQRK